MKVPFLQQNKEKFPFAFFIIAVVLTIGFFVGEGAVLWHSYTHQEMALRRSARLESLSHTIVHLDEVLTMSARLAAATGDLRWEQRYRFFEPQLDLVIKEAESLSPELLVGKDAFRLNESNLRLVAMENRAFDLVRAGKAQEALTLLLSKEYEEQKDVYAKAIKKIDTAVESSLKKTFRDLQMSSVLASVALFCLVVILTMVWLIMVWQVRRYDYERKHLELTLRKEKDLAQTYFDTAGVILVVLDAQGRVTTINQRGCDILGYAKEEIVGKIWFDNFIPAEISDSMKDIFSRIMHKEDGLFGYFENNVLTKNGGQRLIGWNNIILRDEASHPAGILSSGEDITERKRAEEKSGRLTRMYSTLYEVNKVILRVHDRHRLFEEVCRIAVEVGHFRMAWIGMAEPVTHLVRPVASYGIGTDFIKQAHVTVQDVPAGQGPTGTAIREGRVSVANDIAKDPRMHFWRKELLERGWRASAAFPIRVGGKVIGAFNFFSSQADVFDNEEVELLEELAANISFALDFMEEEYSRKLIEETLRESEFRYKIVTHETGHMIYDYEIKSGQIRWAGAIEELTGYSRNEFQHVDIGRWEAMIHPDDRQRALTLLEESRVKGDRYHVNYRFRHKNGAYMLVEDRGLFLRDKEGRAYRMLGMMKETGEKT